VTAETRRELAGKTFIFPRRLTVEELEERVAARLKDDYEVGYVDVELARDGTVSYLALGRRTAGVGPTLPPGTAAVAVTADPPNAAAAGDLVQVWRTDGDRPKPVTTAELRAVHDDTVTLSLDEYDAQSLAGATTGCSHCPTSRGRPPVRQPAAQRRRDDDRGVRRGGQRPGGRPSVTSTAPSRRCARATASRRFRRAAACWRPARRCTWSRGRTSCAASTARPPPRSTYGGDGRVAGMEWKLFADLAEVGGDRHVEVDVEPGETVGDALDALVDARPALADRVLTEDGDLRHHVNVLRNGENVRNLDGLATELDAGDELAMFPPVSGADVHYRASRVRGRRPENTAAAVHAAANRADGIEVDVQPRADGTPVLFHDQRLDDGDDSRGITDASGFVWDADRETLDDANVLGSGEGVPDLESVADLLPPGVEFHVELKNPGSEDARLGLPGPDAAQWRPFVKRVVDALADCEAPSSSPPSSTARWRPPRR